MKILISGASGLVGTRLVPALKEKGHDVFRLVRKTPAAPDEIQWDAQRGVSERQRERLEAFDAVVHLAGDNLASDSWSEEKKRRIRDSRVVGTRVLVEALGHAANPPKIFISASGTGYYGDRGDEPVTEDAPAGEGFLAEVCLEWEAEARKAEEFGARVVMLRTGVVVAREGGALAKMLTPFNLGVGGVVGSGRQWWSWIAIDDLIGVINFALENDSLRGPVNAVAPNPVTNKEFTKTLGRVLGRPTILPVPEFAVKLLFGEMGQTILLEGVRVVPQRLEEAGFRFAFPNLEDALRHSLD